MILYIGNKLSEHGFTPTSVETLGVYLSKEYEMKLVSDKKNKIYRLIDIIYSILLDRKRIKLVLIDTYSSYNFYLAILAAYTLKILKIPYISLLRGGDLPSRLENSKILSNFYFNNSVTNIAPSEYLLNKFKKYNYKVEYIPNSIEISNYKYKKRTLFSPRILYVRAFEKVYNPLMAIEVLKLLSNKYNNVKLCMVGPDKDGTLRDVLHLAKTYQLENMLEVTGKLSKKEWINLSTEYDIFINTTNFDNTPISVIESMALGLPVISTNAGGVPYLVNHKLDGVLVEKNDSLSMFRHISEIIENPEIGTFLAENARKKVEHYNITNVMNLWKVRINEFI